MDCLPKALAIIIIGIYPLCTYGDRELNSGTLKLGDDEKTRIVGGKESIPNNWPWMAALIDPVAGDNYNGQFCGGMLIHPRYILTAAHCVEDIEPENLVAVLGLHRLDDTEFSFHNVVDIIIHPDWDTYLSDSDIALLVLENPAEGFEILPLITDGSLLDDPDVVATAIGWGNTDPVNSSYPFELREVDVPILSNSTVNAANSYNGDVSTNMLAAGFMAGSKDSCQGDSGGPLIVPDGEAGYLLAGIVSWGEGCAEPNFPGIYTRVGNFRNWVFSYIMPKYHEWELTNGSFGEYLDEDVDTRSQFSEYAFGTDPLSASSQVDIAHGFHEIDSEDYFFIEFPTLTENQEIKYQVMTSGDLEAWDPLDENIFGITPLGAAAGALEPFAVRNDLSTSETSKAFMRVDTEFSDNYVAGTFTVSPQSGRRSALHDGDEENSLRTGRLKKDFAIEDLSLGQTYALGLYSNEFNAYLQLLNASTMAEITSDNNSGPSTNSLITFTPQAGVDYIARVTTSQTEEEGRFSLGIDTQIVMPGQTLTGSLSNTDELDPIYTPNASYYKDDYYLIAPINGGALDVSLNSSSFDAYLEIIDTRDGLLITEDDDSGSGLNARIQTIFYGGQEVLIRVTSALELETGSYTLEVSD